MLCSLLMRSLNCPIKSLNLCANQEWGERGKKTHYDAAEIHLTESPEIVNVVNNFSSSILSLETFSLLAFFFKDTHTTIPSPEWWKVSCGTTSHVSWTGLLVLLLFFPESFRKISLPRRKTKRARNKKRRQAGSIARSKLNTCSQKSSTQKIIFTFTHSHIIIRPSSHIFSVI